MKKLDDERNVRSGNLHTVLIATLCLLLLIFWIGCDKYPSNPVEPQASDQIISLEHTATEYLDVEHHIEGLVTSKANMLTFTVHVSNIQAAALEVNGNVTIGGPPYQKEFAFTFRTDSLLIELDNCEVEQALITSIDDGGVFSFNRPVLPPNEFSPFEGEQGKVDSIILKNVWAISEDGSKKIVDFIF